MHMTPRHDAAAGGRFSGLFGVPENKPWFEPTPLRTLFAHMLARRRRLTANDVEDRTGYDPSMMGLS